MMLSAKELKHHQESYHGFLKMLGISLATLVVVLITVFSLITH
jgi:hypothetical protein